MKTETETLHQEFPFDTHKFSGGRWYAWCDALHYSKNEAEREGWSPISDDTKWKAYLRVVDDPRWQLKQSKP